MARAGGGRGGDEKMTALPRAINPTRGTLICARLKAAVRRREGERRGRGAWRNCFVRLIGLSRADGFFEIGDRVLRRIRRPIRVPDASASRPELMENARPGETSGPTTFSVGMARASRRLRIVLFSSTFALFMVSPVILWSDAQYTLLVSQSILTNHTPALNGYSIPGLNAATLPSHSDLLSPRPDYQLVNLKGKLLYFYPHGSSILSLPFVAFMNTVGLSAVRSDGSYNYLGEIKMQKILACLLMAVLACVFLAIAEALLPLSWSAAIAFTASLGTPIWSSATRALWSQTWETFLAGCVILVLLRAEGMRRPLNVVTLATLVSWMYFVRPTGAVVVAGTTLFVLLFYREDFFRYAITGSSWALLFFIYWWVTFGQLLPDYYHELWHPGRGDFEVALAAVLVSPSRGFLVFVPVAWIVIFFVARHWRELQHKRLAVLASGIIAAEVVIVSSYAKWWGGWSYGPRLLTETIPWLVVLAALGCKAFLTRWSRPQTGSWWLAQGRSVITAAMLLMTLSIAINAWGAISVRPGLWNARVDIDAHPERVWDWRSPQFLAGLIDGER